MAKRRQARKTTRKPKRPYVPPPKPAKFYVSPKISLESLEPEFSRADLEFTGIDHSGASYEARIFVNNPKANERTATTPKNGYAGCFHVFGHGGCFGDVGHCDVLLRRPYDPRPAHPLTPTRKAVIATDAIRRAMRQAKHMTLTIVPIVTGGTEKSDFEDVLKFDRVSVVSYN